MISSATCLLSLLQTVGEQVTSLLMEQDDILSYMFTLLAQKKTFINSCQLIEDMLQTKKILLDLNKISMLLIEPRHEKTCLRGF